jgi:hypothetical protein
MQWVVWTGAVPAPVEWSMGNEAVFWGAVAVAVVPAAVAVWRTWASVPARAGVSGFNVADVSVAVGRGAA